MYAPETCLRRSGTLGIAWLRASVPNGTEAREMTPTRARGVVLICHMVCIDAAVMIRWAKMRMKREWSLCLVGLFFFRNDRVLHRRRSAS